MHHFEPQGVTGILLLAESHLSVHTWPEHGYAAVDFYSCGSADLEVAVRSLKASFCATSAETIQIERGRGLHVGPLQSV